jgi:hypothetical protein
MPIDIIKPFLELLERPGKTAATNGAGRVALAAETSPGL